MLNFHSDCGEVNQTFNSHEQQQLPKLPISGEVSKKGKTKKHYFMRKSISGNKKRRENPEAKLPYFQQEKKNTANTISCFCASKKNCSRGSRSNTVMFVFFFGLNQHLERDAHAESSPGNCGLPSPPPPGSVGTPGDLCCNVRSERLRRDGALSPDQLQCFCSGKEAGNPAPLLASAANALPTCA